ncbi:hypothetical protein RJ55_00277 [Drechmeria coniospora]|nr:hypothetical protein RJ55_00277 [Drechmeria coniospora]
MPISPIITFKAGRCDAEMVDRPARVKPREQPGYVYLYSEDDLVHFCWRKRNDSLDEPELDLVMVPTDGSFSPYEYDTTVQPTAKTNGRIFVLKFASSSQRYLFWLQSKPQSRNGDPSWFSPRDRLIGHIVHRLLQGEEDLNVARELAGVRNVDDRRDDDDDETMEDVEGTRGPHDHRGGGGGGAGPDATGGDVREEGESSREGGADGARAASSSTSDVNSVVRNLLESLRNQPGLAGEEGQAHTDRLFPSLSHLLPTSITTPMVDGASPDEMDSLLNLLPPRLLIFASGASGFDGTVAPTPESVEAAKASLSLDDKRSLLRRTLNSPQFRHALDSLTSAIRDGGLPGVADALGIRVANGGYMSESGMPLGGDQAMEAFVEGVKTTVEEEGRRESEE